MSRYVLTYLARADIFRIWSYIAEDNEFAADHVERAIYDACPLTGHIRPDLTQRALRLWTVPAYPNYIVVYRPDTVPVQIVAVLHGRRNLSRLLKERL